MKKAVVLTYNTTSKSAKYLTQQLEGRMITHMEEIRPDECMINWGGGYFPSRAWHREWLNKPSAICNAVDKLVAFHLFKEHGVQRPFWTSQHEIVRRWLQEGSIVVARQTSTGMMGQGISLLTTPSTPIPSAKFFTKHVQHDKEYRVHIFKGMVINLGYKRQLRQEANLLIRNADEYNWDFYYTSTVPYPVIHEAIAAVQSLGLDFGAADVGYQTNRSQAWVFEVNTAPGIGHHTITKYAQHITRYLRSLYD